ncbi:MAG: sodium/proline symporter, partial [Myxococcota bacterium]|nr:sodium/proline symporter [Myxococcota bacterium]
GDLLAWLFVYRRVRGVSGRLRVNSLPALIGQGRERTVRAVVVLAGLLTFVFLGAYAAAQLEAGSAALQSLLGWPPWSGVALGAGIVVAYCFAGGLRASIWTDAAQSFVMLGTMAWILVAAGAEVGGPARLVGALAAQDPALTRWVPEGLAFGLPLYALGFVVGGFGVIGQPHIVIRPMSLDRPEDVARARLYYFLWFVPFTAASFAVGLYARALLPELTEVATAGLSPEQVELARVQASERALPEMAGRLLPELLVGLSLAGLFAATISTADSQVLACSAAITQDAFPRWRRSYLASKVATLAVTALALGVALTAGRGVFSLVLIAWSALASSLGALLLMRLRGGPAGPWTGVAVAVAGVATVVLWERSALADDVFKLLPALALALAVGGILRTVRRRRSG